MNKIIKKTEVNDFDYMELSCYVDNNNLHLESDKENYYLLEQSEKLVDGEIVDNSEEYNKNQQKDAAEREISELKQYLKDNDYKVSKCTEFRELGLPTPYDLSLIHEDFESKRARINELEKLLLTKS